MDSCNCGRRPMGMPYAGRITPAGGCGRPSGMVTSDQCNSNCANPPVIPGNSRNSMSCANSLTPSAISRCNNEIHCHGPIAMAYVPWQTWKETYPLDRALVRGTIFPELDQPFVMGRCR